MTDLAKWKRGRVDEEWKLKVIEKNRENAISIVNGLNTILFGGPSNKPWNVFEEQTSLLRGLTGDQIADALNAYWAVNEADLKQGREWNEARKTTEK